MYVYVCIKQAVKTIYAAEMPRFEIMQALGK